MCARSLSQNSFFKENQRDLGLDNYELMYLNATYHLGYRLRDSHELFVIESLNEL